MSRFDEQTIAKFGRMAEQPHPGLLLRNIDEFTERRLKAAEELENVEEQLASVNTQLPNRIKKTAFALWALISLKVMRTGEASALEAGIFMYAPHAFIISALRERTMGRAERHAVRDASYNHQVLFEHEALARKNALEQGILPEEAPEGMVVLPLLPFQSPVESQEQP